MSTILKALRRLEHEKSAFEARPLQDEIAAVAPPPTRRGFPVLGVVLACVAALGLGLGASHLWLWPIGQDASPLAGGSMAPPPAVAAPVVPSEPLAVAVAPVPPVPMPEPVAETPEPVAAPVASAPPPQAFASPVEVVERPEPVVAAQPAPAPPDELAAAAPAASPQAPPKPGELPPFDSRRRAAQKAESPPPAPVERPIAVAALDPPALARSQPAEQAKPAAAPPAKATPRKPPPEKVVRANMPEVFVTSTVWHPQKNRRLAKVSLADGASREVHEGDAIGPLVVSLIEPSGVVFLHDGVELRRRVGAKN